MIVWMSQSVPIVPPNELRTLNASITHAVSLGGGNGGNSIGVLAVA